MENLFETQELVQKAQEKQYVDFKEKAKEILRQKTAEKMAEMGYFDRMDQAKGIFEACDGKGPKGKGMGKGKEEIEEEDEEEDKDEDKEKIEETF